MQLPHPNSQLSRRTLLLVAVLFALFLLWPYIYCLSAVAYNYAWWILFSSGVVTATPAAAAQVTPQHQAGGFPVPKIIHQTWRDANVPEKWQEARQACMDLHPDYEFRLWTDKDALQLIKEKYAWFLGTYLSYPHSIQRADALRYFVLHEFGGIYLDLDIKCLKSLDFVRAFNFTAPKTYPIGVSNDFLASAPHDAFAHRLITNLRSWQHWFAVKYATVMFSTGPMFVTVQFSLHNNKQGIAILPSDLYGKYKGNHRVHESRPGMPGPPGAAAAPGTAATPGLAPDVALMEHLHGSSWHGQDAGLVFFLEHYGLKALLAAAVLLPLVAAVLWWQHHHHGKFRGVEGRASMHGACTKDKGLGLPGSGGLLVGGDGKGVLGWLGGSPWWGGAVVSVEVACKGGRASKGS